MISKMVHPRTHRRILAVAAVIGVVIAAFIVGRKWEHLRNGRWYQVHDERQYAGKLGRFYLRHVTDTQGWPFLDSGNSVISFEAVTGLEVCLYESRRVFQESWPWVEDVQIEGEQVKWSDGLHRYSLRIERVVATTQP